MVIEIGIVPRAIQDLFERLQKARETEPDFHFDISVSFLELYNEELVDLLSPKERPSTANSGPIIRELNGKIIWSGITEQKVDGPDDLFE